MVGRIAGYGRISPDVPEDHIKTARRLGGINPWQ
jgi:hypothetical protein